MIPVRPVPEPPSFNEQARIPGNRWLARHPEKRPRDYWSPFLKELADGFGDLCAYCAIYIPVKGTVDHFISCHENRSQAYEWRNYRYCLHTINSRKGATPARRLLDPCKIQEGWFEILLPSLQLRVSDTVPQQFREQADFVLDRLGLNDEWMVRTRCAWYEMYTSGQLTLDGLRKKAPLIAAAATRSGGS